MNMINEAIRNRHSVRSYSDGKIEKEKVDELRKAIEECNRSSGLNIQLITEEPTAFDSFMAHYGKFSGVRNYIAMFGKKGEDERIGYYGEKLVLLAQSMGLNTCWVALTYSKGKAACTVLPGEKLVCVISLGYGLTQGVPHKSKPLESLCKTDGSMPEWFRRGMEAALLAPTAMNQQKFMLSLAGNTVSAKAGMGFYTKLDLGIVKCHVELAAEGADWHWAN